MLVSCCNNNAHKWKRSVWSVYSSYRWGGQEGGCGRMVLTGWNNKYEKLAALHSVSRSTQRLIFLKYNFSVLCGQIFDRSGSVSEFSASQYAITHEQSQLITFVWPKMSSPFYPNLRVSLHLAPTRKATARTPSLSLLYVELQHIQSARRHAGDKKQH